MWIYFFMMLFSWQKSRMARNFSTGQAATFRTIPAACRCPQKPKQWNLSKLNFYRGMWSRFSLRIRSANQRWLYNHVHVHKRYLIAQQPQEQSPWAIVCLKWCHEFATGTDHLSLDKCFYHKTIFSPVLLRCSTRQVVCLQLATIFIEAKVKVYKNRQRLELSLLVLFKSSWLSNQYHYAHLLTSQSLLAGHMCKAELLDHAWSSFPL